MLFFFFLLQARCDRTSARYLRHYLELFSILVIAWMHIKLSNPTRDDALGCGLRRGARYWLATEVPRIEHLATLCSDAEDSYLTMEDDWF